MYMNKSIATMVMATSVLLGACNQEAKKAEDTKPVIGRSEIKIADGRMTPEALWAMGRIGGMNVSPDRKQFTRQLTTVFLSTAATVKCSS